MMRGSRRVTHWKTYKVVLLVELPIFKYQKESLLVEKKIGRKEETGAEENIFPKMKSRTYW